MSTLYLDLPGWHRFVATEGSVRDLIDYLARRDLTNQVVLADLADWSASRGLPAWKTVRDLNILFEYRLLRYAPHWNGRLRLVIDHDLLEGYAGVQDDQEVAR